MEVTSKASLVVTSAFLVLVVMAFVAFIIYHFVTKCNGCPVTSCPVVVQEVKA